MGAADATARARALLSHGPANAPVCAHADPALPFHQRWETVATITLDVAAAALSVHPGGPCTATPDSWQHF